MESSSRNLVSRTTRTKPRAEVWLSVVPITAHIKASTVSQLTACSSYNLHINPTTISEDSSALHQSLWCKLPGLHFRTGNQLKMIPASVDVSTGYLYYISASSNFKFRHCWMLKNEAQKKKYTKRVYSKPPLNSKRYYQLQGITHNILIFNLIFYLIP